MASQNNTPESPTLLDRLGERVASVSDVLKWATAKQLEFASEILTGNTQIDLAREKEARLTGNEKRAERERILGMIRSKNRLQRAEMLTAENGVIRNEALKEKAREVLKQGGFDWVDARDLLSLEQAERGVLSKVFAFKRGKDAEGFATEEPLDSGKITEWDEIMIDFWRNASANAKIGAADILPPSVRIIKIVDRDMNVRVGVRQVIDGRAGYYDANGKYLPIYTGFSIRVPTSMELSRPEYAGFKVSKVIETDTKTLDLLNKEDAEAMARFKKILEQSVQEDKVSTLYGMVSAEAGSSGSYAERLARMIEIAEKYEKSAEGDDKNLLTSLISRLKKTKEVLGDRNIGLDFDRYKSAIAKHESGSLGYLARNDEEGKKRGVRPGAWAFGKYQFTVETLRGYGVDLGIPPEEGKIQAFLQNGTLQEEIMDKYMVQCLEKYILPNPKIAEDMARDGTSLSYYLALTHIGGPGALSWNTLKKDWLGTSTHTYAMGVANVYERNLIGDQVSTAVARKEGLPGARINPEDLIQSAERHMGKSYRLGGDGTTSIDCSQLIVEALKDNQVVHSRYDATAAMFATNSSPKHPKDVERGDLVFIRENGKVTHVEIALGRAQNGSIEVLDATPKRWVSKRRQAITSEVEVGTPYFYA